MQNESLEERKDLEWINRECAAKPATRDHLFTVGACGGDAELICVLQKVMERFCDGLKYADLGPVNAAAVAEWFYAKYGRKRP